MQTFTAIEPKRSFRAWEYIRCSGGIKLNNGTPFPDEYGLELFVVKVNNRFERIAIVKSRNTCGGLSVYYPSDRRNYHDVIENFLFSLQFSDWLEPVVKPGTVKDDGITSVWQGISMSVGTSKPGAVLGAELDKNNSFCFQMARLFRKKFSFRRIV